MSLLNELSREQLEEILRYVIVHETGCSDGCRAKNYCRGNIDHCTCSDNYIAWYLHKHKE